MTATVSSQRQAHLVTVSGEVDVSTAYDLQIACDETVILGVGPVVIDLTQVEFMDSSGITTLVRAQRDLGRQGRRLAVVCPPGGVRRLFEIVRLEERLGLYQSLPEALAAIEAPR